MSEVLITDIEKKGKYRSSIVSYRIKQVSPPITSRRFQLKMVCTIRMRITYLQSDQTPVFPVPPLLCPPAQLYSQVSFSLHFYP